MNRKEIENRIEEIKTRRFYLSMADHWDREDFELDSKLSREQIALTNLLKEAE